MGAIQQHDNPELARMDQVMELPESLNQALAQIDEKTRTTLLEELHNFTSTLGMTFQRHAPEPTPPGLEFVQTSFLRTDDRTDAPTHRIINGENLHALNLLAGTHAGKVDLIYIDPPYNTGFAYWKYNDKHSDRTDADSHSRWLSFMSDRLVLAKKLLSPIGVIFVAIGDDEQHRLRMLMDEVFGEENFLANIVWQGETKGAAPFTGGGMEYMLAYGRDRAQALKQGVKWVEPKAGAAQAQALVNNLMRGKDAGTTQQLAAEATKALRSWLKANRAWITDSLSSYSTVDEDGRIFRPGPLNAPDKPELRSFRPIIHPVTGKPCRTPPNGWRAKDETMDQWLAAGEVLFGQDETSTPSKKLFLDRLDKQAPKPSFTLRRRAGTKHLESILGDQRFQYPKDHEVLMRWIRMAAPKDAVVLDFFGGSGTTAEAVMRLNAEDGGTRQCILVTNNELSKADDLKMRAAGHEPGSAEYESLGVYQHVTKPRLTTIVTGIRRDGSHYSDGLQANVSFEDLR